MHFCNNPLQRTDSDKDGASCVPELALANTNRMLKTYPTFSLSPEALF